MRIAMAAIVLLLVVTGCSDGNSASQSKLTEYAGRQYKLARQQAAEYQFAEAIDTLDLLEQRINADAWVATYDEWTPKIKCCREEINGRKEHYEEQVSKGWKLMDGRLTSPEEQKAQAEKARLRRLAEEREKQKELERQQREEQQRKIELEEERTLKWLRAQSLEITYDKFEDTTLVASKVGEVQPRDGAYNGDVILTFWTVYQGTEKPDNQGAEVIMTVVSFATEWKYLSDQYAGTVSLKLIIDGERYELRSAHYDSEVDTDHYSHCREVVSYEISPYMQNILLKAKAIEMKMGQHEIVLPRTFTQYILALKEHFE